MTVDALPWPLAAMSEERVLRLGVSLPLAPEIPNLNAWKRGEVERSDTVWS